jgi:tRNA threonylcarbamoyladenosine modification (KEOPS) complex  Pcc1 subunit
MITAVMTIPSDAALAALLKTEEETFRHARSSYTVRDEGKNIVIEIAAKDATALRATTSSICRVLAVHEKAKNIR